MPASDSLNRARSVGSYLRESRESQGISLEEAARVTRIGKNYLTALEEEAFDALPNTAYIKGFLRAYAAFLGLSGDEIVAIYERALSPVPPRPADEVVAPPASGTEKVKAPRRGHWGVTLVLLALVVAVAYIFDGKDEIPEKSPSPVEPPPAARIAGSVQLPLSSVRGATTAAGISADSGGDSRAAAAEPLQDGIVLKLKVNQDSWLNITIDDAVSQHYDLKAGDLIEWKGDRVFALDMGNAGGVEAELNGKPLKPFGEPGTTAHVVLKADGTSP